jgi:hypothetical protein
MARHERNCIKNPERVCDVCRERIDIHDPQVPPEQLLEAFSAAGAGDRGMTAICDLTDCPCCILATLCQHRLKYKTLYEDDDEGRSTAWIEFDYKAEMTKFRNTHEPFPYDFGKMDDFKTMLQSHQFDLSR